MINLHWVVHMFVDEQPSSRCWHLQHLPWWAALNSFLTSSLMSRVHRIFHIFFNEQPLRRFWHLCQWATFVAIGISFSSPKWGLGPITHSQWVGVLAAFGVHCLLFWNRLLTIYFLCSSERGFSPRTNSCGLLPAFPRGWEKCWWHCKKRFFWILISQWWWCLQSMFVFAGVWCLCNNSLATFKRCEVWKQSMNLSRMVGKQGN